MLRADSPAWLLVGQVIELAGLGLTYLVLGAIEGPGEVGIAAAALLVANAVAVGLGAGTGTLRQAVATELDGRRVWAAILLVGTVGLIAVEVGATPAAAALGTPEARPLILALGPIVLLRRINDTHQALLDLQGRYRLAVSLKSATTVLGSIAGVLGAIGGMGPWAIVVHYLISEGAQTIIGVALVERPRILVDRETISWIRSGGSLSLLSVMTWIYNNADDMIIVRAFGQGALGNYSIAYNLASAPAFLAGRAMSRWLTARLAGRPNNEWGGIVSLGIRRAHLASAAVAVAVLAVAPPLLLTVLGGEWKLAAAMTGILVAYGYSRGVGSSMTGPLVLRRRIRPLHASAFLQIVVLFAGTIAAALVDAILLVVTAVTISIVPGVLGVVASALRASRVEGPMIRRTVTMIGATAVALAVVGWLVASRYA